jgi:hypothetical protein
MTSDKYYKDKVTNKICLECKRYNDISRVLEAKSKFGIYEYCESKCGYKKTLKKFLTKAQKFAKKFPINKELRKIKLKEMRESKKNCSFQGIKVSLD